MSWVSWLCGKMHLWHWGKLPGRRDGADITSESTREVGEQHASSHLGKQPHQGLRRFTTLPRQEFSCGVCSEQVGQGDWICHQGERKNSPRREAANIPPRNQNQEKGKRRRDGLPEFHPLPSFWIPQEAAGWDQCPGHPRNCSLSEKLPSLPQPQLPRPACLHWV